MLRNLRGGDDPVANATRKDRIAADRAAAIAADSARIRAGIAAGRGRRSIGTTRTPAGEVARHG
jgi:hypothetical protein